MASTKQRKSFEPGFVVEIWTEWMDPNQNEGVVGEVQSVDEQGIRLTLFDWLGGRFTGWDRFIPWKHIGEASIATPDHDVALFLNEIVRRNEQRQEGRRPSGHLIAMD